MYFEEQAAEKWGRYKVTNGEDVYTSDSLEDAQGFADKFGFNSPKFSDPIEFVKHNFKTIN